MTSRDGRRDLAAGMVFALAVACGGGGSGGGGNQPASGIALSSQTLRFAANQDDSDAPPSQAVTVSALGGSRLGSTLYAKIEQSNGDMINSANLDCAGGATCALSVSVVPAYRFVEPGVVNGTVTVVACADTLCSSGPVPDGRKIVSVEYSIGQGFTVTPHLPQRLSFAGSPGSPPPAQTISLSHPTGQLPPWNGQPGTFSPWLTITPASSEAPSASPSNVMVSVADAAPGTYETSVEFRYGNSPRSVVVGISYTVR